MLSVVIPANNEEALIGRCLRAVLASDGPDGTEVIVVANGCHDNTAAEARRFSDQFDVRGWSLRVLDLAEGSKPGALNAGDEIATGDIRLYLDADVVVDAQLLAALSEALATETPLYASGHLRIAEPESRFSRAYARIYRQVPFMREGVPGAGVFAVNTAGRARWETFPQIISDDTFVRLHFAPEERLLVPPGYDWPVVEGARALLKVRRRQDRGVAEIRRKFPQLLKNDDARGPTKGEALTMALRDPLGFVAYAGVGLWARFGRNSNSDWARGR